MAVRTRRRDSLGFGGGASDYHYWAAGAVLFVAEFAVGVAAAAAASLHGWG